MDVRTDGWMDSKYTNLLRVAFKESWIIQYKGVSSDRANIWIPQPTHSNNHCFNPFNPLQFVIPPFPITCNIKICKCSSFVTNSKHGQTNRLNSVLYGSTWMQQQRPTSSLPAASLFPASDWLIRLRWGVVWAWDLVPVCSASSERWRFSPSHTPTVTHARIYSS